MTATVPTREPRVLHAGETWAWTRAFTDYPASAGWALSYIFTNAAARFTISASADGDDHAVNVAAADTAARKAGWYDWTAFITLGAENHAIDRGRTEIRPNLQLAQNFDLRSEARQIQEALRAAYKAYVETGALRQSYTIAGRQMQFRDGAKLLEELEYWTAQVRAEEAEAAIDNGKPVGRRLLARL